jgi:hypothetical protein
MNTAASLAKAQVEELQEAVRHYSEVVATEKARTSTSTLIGTLISILSPLLGAVLGLVALFAIWRTFR